MKPSTPPQTKLAYFLTGLIFVFLGFYLSSQLWSSKKLYAQETAAPSAPTEANKNAPSSLPPTEEIMGDEPIPSEMDLHKAVIPVFETGGEYRYEPVGKRDPFRPYRDAKVGVGQLRSVSRPLDPLEKFDVKTLEVVAIVWANDRPKALIQDPEKGIHSVVKGQRIGRNEGYIAEIREGEVVVVELFDLNGKIVKEPYVMCIDKTKGCGL